MTVSDELIGLAARLREARRARGVSQESAAQEIGVSRPTLIALEQGRRPAKPDEVVRLARLYGRSVAELVRPTTAVSGLVAQFRVGSGAGAHGTAIALAVDDLQRLADSVVALEETTGVQRPRHYPAPYDVSGLPPEAAAEQVADAERRRLGLGDGPLPQLRSVLENDVGLLVFAVPLASKVAALYGYAEPAGGCVAVNSRHPHERQRWSLAHEYAHFLTSRHGAEVTALPGASRTSAGERLADAFGGHFLMPALGLARRFNAQRQSRGGRFSAGDLLQLAALYEVSAEAMALRLESLRLTTPGWWKSLRDRGLRVEQAKELVGLATQPGGEELLPLRHRYLAVEAHLSGELSEGQLVELLRLDRLAVRDLVARLAASCDVDEAGDVIELSYEPSDSAPDAAAR